MDRIKNLPGQRVPVSIVFTFFTVLIALMMIFSVPSPLVRSARADGAANAGDEHDNYVLAQVAKLHELHAALHELGSGNGDPLTRADHLAALGALYAEDATLTVAATGQVVKGRDAIVNFFAATPMFNNDWLSMTVAFRTSFDVANDGHSANISLECHWVDPATGEFKVERRLAGTATNVHGTWVLQDVTASAATL